MLVSKSFQKPLVFSLDFFFIIWEVIKCEYYNYIFYSSSQDFMNLFPYSPFVNKAQTLFTLL